MPAQEVNEITEKIIGCAYTVGNTLGIGFVEKIYENALVFCTRKTGLLVEQLNQEHTAQALNYLRATGVEVCLLINFGKPKIEIKRLLPSVHWRTPKP